MEHTPGPWVSFGCADNTRKFGIRAMSPGWTDYRVAYTAGGLAGDQLIREANARLIAAAPDLLAACRDLLAASNRFQNGARDGGTMGQISAAMDSARAAVAKAEGRP